MTQTDSFHMCLQASDSKTAYYQTSKHYRRFWLEKMNNWEEESRREEKRAGEGRCLYNSSVCITRFAVHLYG